MRALGVALAACLTLAACGGEDDPGITPDAPGVPGSYTVSGVVRYEDKPPLPTGGLGPVTPVVARGVQVAIVDDTSGATLVMGTTGDDGSYTLTFDGVSGEPVHVLAVPYSTVPGRPLEVVQNDGTLHGFGGATFPTATTTHDVLVTVQSGAAGAFNIFDMMVLGIDRVRALDPAQQLRRVTAVWEVGSNDGTYYFNDELHLLGEASDDDGFDDTVILHELGHHIEDAYGRSDSPGGAHDGTPTDPRLAWSEGFATYFALAIRDLPVYMDSNAGGGWAYNADTSLTKANPGGPLNQPVSEDMVSEILWDMGDAPATDDDPLAGTHDPVLVVQRFLKTATLRAVGSGGVDLVDALDGWFLTSGLASCAGVRSIVNTERTFPYDYGSAAGTCP